MANAFFQMKFLMREIFMQNVKILCYAVNEAVSK